MEENRKLSKVRLGSVLRFREHLEPFGWEGAEVYMGRCMLASLVAYVTGPKRGKKSQNGWETR